MFGALCCDGVVIQIQYFHVWIEFECIGQCSDAFVIDLNKQENTSNPKYLKLMM